MTADPLADSFAGSRVLITGGAGFIGSSLGRRLVGGGAEVTLVDSMIREYGGNLANIRDYEARARLNVTDIRDSHSMPHLVQGVDFVFNLAGQTSHLDSMADPFTDLEINVRAQAALLEAIRANSPGARIVFASTRQIYGRPRYLPVDETHPIAPIDVNGINKAAAESYHLVYHAAHSMRTSVLRLTNTYGPGMRVKDARQTFVGIWIKNVLSDLPIQVYGTGEQLRDLCYVDDAVEAFLLSARNEAAIGTALNIGGGAPISLLALAHLLVDTAGSGAVDVIPFPDELRPIDIGDYYSDDAAARRLLGWQPQIPLEAGLAKTLDYYRTRSVEYFT